MERRWSSQNIQYYSILEKRNNKIVLLFQKDRKTERQKDRNTQIQKDRKTERQKDRKTEIHKYRKREI
jgi:hypothetical protein